MPQRWVDGAPQNTLAQRSECSAALVVVVRDCGESLLAGSPRGSRQASEDGRAGGRERRMSEG